MGFCTVAKKSGSINRYGAACKFIVEQKLCAFFHYLNCFFGGEQISKWLFELTNFLPFATIWFLVMTSFPLSGYLIYPIFQKAVI